MNTETRPSFDEAKMSFWSEIPRSAEEIREINEEKRRTRLQSFQDRHIDSDGSKAIYRSNMSQFGQLLLAGNFQEEKIKTILTEDCEIFIFNFVETPVEFAFRHEGFAKLFEDKRVIRREVKETYISLKKATGFQICDCEVIDDRKGTSMSQFSFEVFSFKGDKISKYRALFGCMPMSYDPPSLFVPTKKERGLAKIRELNYAWADQPDLEKIASLMHESTEFKVWRWQDNKCFIFDKKNLVSEFKKSLEEEFVITSIVPYGISCEAQYVVGSYVYHLESKSDGQKFIWISNCIFTFDQEFNIKKMSQQGELHLENETVIPFQAQSPSKFFKSQDKSELETRERKREFSIFDMEALNFSFDCIFFGFRYSPFTGHIKGLSDISRMQQVMSNQDLKLEKRGIVEYYEDIDDPCYDSLIALTDAQGIINKEDCPWHRKSINFINFGKLSFENGKVAKILFFAAPIPDPIPSPYDDISFTGNNIRAKSEFIESHK